MKYINWVAGLLALGMIGLSAYADEHSISEDQVVSKKVYWGSCESFTKAATVNYTDIIKATPEYEEMIEEKVERGSGKYWILMSQASDRVVKALAHVGEKSEYDLICASGYLNGLDPPIESDDLTEKVIEAMEELMGD